MPPEDSERQSDVDLAVYVRTNLIRTGIGIALLMGTLVLVGTWYQAELLSLTHRVYTSVGIFGLMLILYITDAIFSPMPPDVVLVVVANSALHDHWPVLLPAMGLLSSVAGITGWFIGSNGARMRWVVPFVARVRRRYEKPIHRFDRWAVVLGAITPLPFSLICITAGALGMPLRRLAPVTLLRIPRFIFFYWLIYYSTAGV